MKIKIFFLISAMNALSYSGYEECCDCWEECFGKKKEIEESEENGKKKNHENGKKDENEKSEKDDNENGNEIKNDNNPEYFVNKHWLNKKKEQGNFFLKLFNKEEDKKYKSKDIEIELKEKEGKTEINISDKKNDLKTDTHKWALFEIKYKEEEEAEDKFVYLYCNDIESEEDDGIFNNMEKFSSISVLACDTSNVKNMGWMFYWCSNLENLNLSNLDTRDVTNMHCMFSNCHNLKNIKFPDKINTSSVTDMSCMFVNCSKLGDLDLSNFDTSNVEVMSNMFFGCQNLKKIKFPDNFNTSNVTDIACMFFNCSSLETLDLSTFNTSRVKDMRFMFNNCNSLNKVTVSNLETKDKIFKELVGKEKGWEESQDNGKFILEKLN